MEENPLSESDRAIPWRGIDAEYNLAEEGCIRKQVKRLGHEDRIHCLIRMAKLKFNELRPAITPGLRNGEWQGRKQHHHHGN